MTVHIPVIKITLTLLAAALLMAMAASALIVDHQVPADLQEGQWVWLSAAAFCNLLAWGTAFFICPRKAMDMLRNVVSWVLIALGSVEACIGIAQVFGFTASLHSRFLLTGTFYNPGPFSGCLAAAFPIALSFALSTRDEANILTKVVHYVSLAAMFLILCVLPAGMSRAAWVATLCASAFVACVFFKDKVKDLLRKYRRWVIVGTVLLLMGMAGAYLMKRDSADGRLFIWKVTLTAIKDHPLGYAGRPFSSVYGDAQERYFTQGSYSPQEEWVAGTPDFAFNEYLQMATMHGVPCAVLFLCVLALAWSNANRFPSLIGLKGSLLSLMIFAFFSYPLHVPGLVAMWVLVLGALVIEKIHRLNKTFLRCIIPLVMIGGGWFLYGQWYEHRSKERAVSQWTSFRMLYHSGMYDSAVKGYETLYDRMSWQDDFCFEYGRALYNSKDYQKAHKVLTDALNICGDPMILNLLGRNAQTAGDYQAAETYLIRASNRLPERTYPYYLMVKLYADNGFFHKEKLLRAARRVLTGEPKVHSRAIEEMQEEVRDILQSKGLTVSY